jgi:Na+-driven multidrug efflux pump
MLLVCLPYMICGVMDTLVGSMRGMGYSILPMIVSLTVACGLRVVWILTVFAANHTLTALFLVYPVSWIVTALAHFVCFVIAYRKLRKKEAAEQRV